MITKYIKLQGYINRSTVQELCGFTDQQARRTIEKMKEENIIEMQKRKKELADMFVENNSGGLSQMSKEDILSLFTM